MASASSSCSVRSEKFFITRPRCRLFSGEGQIQPEGTSDTAAPGRIGAQTIGDVALFDVPARIANSAGRVLEQSLPLRECHRKEKIARLCPVIVVDIMVPVRRL